MQGTLADNLTLCVDRVTNHCVKFGSTKDDRNMCVDFRKKIISRGWITKILDRSKFKAMDNLIIEYRSRDSAMRAVINYCEDINLIIPIVTNSTKKQHWRINI